MGKVFVLLLALVIIITAIAMDSRLTVMSKCLKLLTKNEPGEHDQVRTHTPHIYNGGFPSSSAIPLDARLSGNFTSTATPKPSPLAPRQTTDSTTNPRSATTITPKPAPTPTPRKPITNKELAEKIPSSAPKFDNRQAEAKWLKDNDIDNRIRLGNIDDRARSQIIEVYLNMGKKYPEVLNNSINTFDSRSPPLNIIDNLVGNKQIDNTFGFAASAYIPKTGIYLNERYLYDKDVFDNKYDETIQTGWHPAAIDGCEVQIMVSHELSHAIYANLPEDKKRKWINATQQGENFVGSRSKLPFIPSVGLSDYAKTDPAECFAEALSAYEYGKPIYRANPLILIAHEMATEK